MSVLVVAEHDNQSVRSATLNTVAAAAKIGRLELRRGSKGRRGDPGRQESPGG